MIDKSWREIWFSYVRAVSDSSQCKDRRERQIVIMLVNYQHSRQEVQNIHITLNLIEVDEVHCCFPLFFLTAYSIFSGLSGPYKTLRHRWENSKAQSFSLCFLYHIRLGGWRDMSALKGLHYSHVRKYLQGHNCMIMHFIFYCIILSIRGAHVANHNCMPPVFILSKAVRPIEKE